MGGGGKVVVGKMQMFRERIYRVLGCNNRMLHVNSRASLLNER